MEVCVRSILTEMEALERGGIQSHMRDIMGDDYDMIPREVLDEEDLLFLSPTYFQKAITA